MFYPRRYQDWLDAAKVYARQAWLAEEPLSGQVEVYADFAGARSNADIDNLTKGVLDAISGIIIQDDKQVAVLEVYRWRSAACRPPGVLISVRPRGAG